jgi:hypothetical protein
MKILLLSHNLDQAKDWIMSQDIANLFILDERSLTDENPNKFKLGFHQIDYSENMTYLMSVKVLSYKSARPLIVLMDMRHQNAVEKVPHDHSILLYDGSLNRRLAYNPRYVVDFTVDFNSKFPVDNLF